MPSVPSVPYLAMAQAGALQSARQHQRAMLQGTQRNPLQLGSRFSSFSSWDGTSCWVPKDPQELIIDFWSLTMLVLVNHPLLLTVEGSEKLGRGRDDMIFDRLWMFPILRENCTPNTWTVSSNWPLLQRRH